MKIRFSKNATFFRYFLSYFLILTVSFIGLYFIVNFQLKQEYRKMDSAPDRIRLENLSNTLSDLFTNINEANISIGNDIDLINSRYSSADYSQYEAAQELKKRITGNALIREIIYIDLDSQKAFTSSIRVSEDNGSLSIWSGTGSESLTIPYGAILASQASSCIVPIYGVTDAAYLYVPPQLSSRYACFFLLNETELKNLIGMCVSSSIVSAMLVTNHFDPLASVNEKPLTQYLPQIRNNPHEQQRYGNSIVYVMQTRFKSLRLVALSDSSAARSSINAVFRNTYLSMVVIALLDILLTWLSMHITYVPLHELTKKIAGGAGGKTEDLLSIRRAFEDTCSENKRLMEKIGNYRLMIQKMIIGSAANEKNAGSSVLADQIDGFFDSGRQNCFLVARLFLETPCQEKKLFLSVQSRLPQDGTCVRMGKDADGVSLLLDCPGPTPPGDDAVRSLFADALPESGCRVSVSGSSANIMDIGRLYDNASLAAEFFGCERFISYDAVKGRIGTRKDLLYPYGIFDELTKNLSHLDFDEAEKTVWRLLDSIDMRGSPEFFVRCILLDTVTLIVGLMNQNNVRFSKYSEAYYETLFLCRSSDYRKTKKSILSHIQNIIGIFSAEAMNSTISIIQVQQFIQENCTDCNFSVAALADHFHMNIAYMSFVFKKRSGMNLTDYLWHLRLEKAKRLLTGTALPIDRISMRVGYENPSSFRRKFKETVGLPPSAYREKNRLAAGGSPSI